VKRGVSLALLAAGCFVIYFLQRAKASAPFTTSPLLYIVADTEREAERIPLAATRVSDADEIKAGQQIVREYQLNSSQPNGPEAARISEYLNAVGMAVSSHVQRQAIRYHFYLRDDRNFVNAFALPGGQIVVGRGLLELIENEDELAVVLGHEIAHVDNRDAIARLQYELASRKIGLGEIYRLGKPAVEIFEAGYTKEEELEADRVGLRFAVAAGYSANGGLSLMKRFEQLEPSNAKRANSPVEEFAQVPFDALQEYFRTHPSAVERIAAMQTEITDRGYDISQKTRPFVIHSIFLADAGERLNRAGDFKDSIARYKEALNADPNYDRALRGLAEASWRFGDAGETTRAETEAIRRATVTASDWKLLSRGLVASDPTNAQKRLEAIEVAKYPTPNESNDLYLAARIELAGVEFLNHRKDALPEFQAILSSFPQSRASEMRAMSWWIYRAGKLDLAVKQLESARQLYPDSSETRLLLAWFLSDLGRQADSKQILGNEPVALVVHDVLAQYLAVRAVIDWRTEDRGKASSEFQTAAQFDPVWMVPRWVANNYSPSTTAVIKDLQTIETERRSKSAQDQHLQISRQ
jgi:beta-barrel assembly-enhancing protease